MIIIGITENSMEQMINLRLKDYDIVHSYIKSMIFKYANNMHVKEYPAIEHILKFTFEYPPHIVKDAYKIFKKATEEFLLSIKNDILREYDYDIE